MKNLFSGLLFSYLTILASYAQITHLQTAPNPHTSVFSAPKSFLTSPVPLSSPIDSSDIRPPLVGPVREFDKVSLGMGLGMDYGGIGANLLVYPGHTVGLFGGVGYALAGVGFNLGIKCRMASRKSQARVLPYGLLMYGYNTAIAVSGASQFNKFFYGPTLGAGIDLLSPWAKAGSGYWTFGLVLPIRSAKVNAYLEELKHTHNIQFTNKLSPIGFSVGYRFILN